MSVTEKVSMESWSDHKLIAHIAERRQRMHKRNRKTGAPDSRVCVLSPGYVSKCYADEAELTDTVKTITHALGLGVRVPPVHRALLRDTPRLELVQARVRGDTLLDAWPHLSLLATLRLAAQLRHMVRRMRASANPTAGSVGLGLVRSPWLDGDRFGIPPRPSAAALAAIVNFWFNKGSFRQEAAKTKADHHAACAGPLAPGPLVFTHQALAPQNLVLERGSGLLWLVGWDRAGWLPAYFEAAGLHAFKMPEAWSWWARLRWRIFTWIAAGGSYAEERRILEVVRDKIGTSHVGRRFSIKAGATLSVRSLEELD